MITVLKILSLVAIAINLIRILLSHYFTWTFFSQYKKFFPPRDKHNPEVSLIIPIKGIDKHLKENLKILSQQNYSNNYEIIFCMENSNEPAFPAIQKTVMEFSTLNYKIVESNKIVSDAFGKIKNLIAGVLASQYDILIFLDSDVTISPSFISETVAEFANSQIGLAFKCPACRGTEDLFAALHNLSVNETILNITPIYRIQKGNAAIGNTIITTRKIIEEIGGLEQFSHQITEDIPLADAIYKKGYQIQLLKKPAIILHPRDNLVNFWRQMHRWLVTIRHYHPEAIALSFIIGFPMIWATIFLILSIVQQEYMLFPLLIFIGTSIIYFVSNAIINIKFAKDKKLWKFIWAVFLLDFIKLPLTIYSFISIKVFWRGRWLKVNKDHTVTISKENN